MALTELGKGVTREQRGAGATAQQAADVVNADGLTAAVIPLAGLSALLRGMSSAADPTMRVMQRLQVITTDNTKLSETITGPMRALVLQGLDNFLNDLGDLRQVNLDTTDPVFAADVNAILGALVLGGEMTQDQPAQIIALGGGYRYGRTDATEVQALWDADDVAVAVSQRQVVGQQLRAKLGAASLAMTERVAAYERGEQGQPATGDLVILLSNTLDS